MTCGTHANPPLFIRDVAVTTARRRPGKAKEGEIWRRGTRQEPRSDPLRRGSRPALVVVGPTAGVPTCRGAASSREAQLGWLGSSKATLHVGPPSDSHAPRAAPRGMADGVLPLPACCSPAGQGGGRGRPHGAAATRPWQEFLVEFGCPCSLAPAPTLSSGERKSSRFYYARARLLLLPCHVLALLIVVSVIEQG